MSPTPDVGTIKSNFEKIRSRFKANDYFYKCLHNCSTGEITDFGRTKCSRLFGGSGPIELCVNTLRGQINPIGLTAQTILHEFGHRYLDFCTDHQYCYWDCGSLSAKDALKNPDSYAVFANDPMHKKQLADAKAQKSKNP